MDIFSLLNPEFRPCFSHQQIPAWVLHALSLRIKTDVDRQILFAHQDIQGRITGWEVGEHEFRGQRSLFFAHIGSSLGRVLIAPRALVAVDYFSGHGRPNDICVSTAGEIEPFQAEILRMLLKSSPVIACTPRGEERFSEQVCELAKHAEVVTRPEWSRAEPEASPNTNPAAQAYSLGGPGDPVSIEQLDAIFSETHEEAPKKKREKLTKKSAPLLAFF